MITYEKEVLKIIKKVSKKRKFPSKRYDKFKLDLMKSGFLITYLSKYHTFFKDIVASNYKHRELQIRMGDIGYFVCTFYKKPNLQTYKITEVIEGPYSVHQIMVKELVVPNKKEFIDVCTNFLTYILTKGKNGDYLPLLTGKHENLLKFALNTDFSRIKSLYSESKIM